MGMALRLAFRLIEPSHDHPRFALRSGIWSTRAKSLWPLRSEELAFSSEKGFRSMSTTRRLDLGISIQASRVVLLVATEGVNQDRSSHVPASCCKNFPCGLSTRETMAMALVSRRFRIGQPELGGVVGCSLLVVPGRPRHLSTLLGNINWVLKLRPGKGLELLSRALVHDIH